MRCPFKIGDKIICISISNISNTQNFTLYKEYVVCDIPASLFNNIGIYNDIGMCIIPNFGNFVTLSEYRKKKLEKIEIS